MICDFCEEEIKDSHYGVIRRKHFDVEMHLRCITLDNTEPVEVLPYNDYDGSEQYQKVYGGYQ